MSIDQPAWRAPWRRNRGQAADQSQNAPDPAGQTPTKPALSPEAQAIVDAFGAQPGVSAKRAKLLQSVIDSSPALAAQLNQAVSTKDLQGFGVQPADVNAGGTYHPDQRRVDMPLSMLDNSSEAAFVLGHEVQHAINRPVTAQSLQQFPQQVHQQAVQGSHDYTQSVGNVIAVQRWDEASANLAGWNSYIQHVQSKHPGASLADVYQASGRAADVLQQAPDGTVQPRPNLTLNADHSAELNQHNIEGMAQNYVDKDGKQSGLGHHGDSDYANYYGAHAVGQVVNFQRQMFPPQQGQPEQPIALNMQQLRLSREQIEKNGVHLGQHQHPMPILDTSSSPPTPTQLHHTHETHTHVPDQPAALRSEPELPGRLNGQQTQRTDPQPGLSAGQTSTAAQQQTTPQQTTQQQSGVPKPTRTQLAANPDLGERENQALQLATVSQGRSAAEATRGNAISIPRSPQRPGQAAERSAAAERATTGAARPTPAPNVRSGRDQ